MPPITIVGIGDDGIDGLTPQARGRIATAGQLVGSRVLLDKIPASVAENPDGQTRIPTGMKLDELSRQIVELDDRPAVLLAGGDPLFYGITRYLVEAFGKDRFDVIPNVSSMQLAFARVKETWDDAYLSNLAVTPLDRVVDALRSADRAGLFTTEDIPPSMVARALLDRRLEPFTAYVCENLGTPDETVTQGSLESIADQSFAPMNVMVLVRRDKAAASRDDSRPRRLFGNPDEAFLQSRPKRGLLTPVEVRSIALGEMGLRRDSVVWDVGAGSGALAIEAASLAVDGGVYAIEMDAEDFGLMVDNAAAFDVPSLHPIHGQAPEALTDLPDPDAVFVGGTGRVVPDLVAASCDRLKPDGRIVVSVGSPDNLIAVQKVIEDSGRRSDVRMINLARGQYQLDRVRFEALNPTFLVLGGK